MEAEALDPVWHSRALVHFQTKHQPKVHFYEHDGVLFKQMHNREKLSELVRRNEVDGMKRDPSWVMITEMIDSTIRQSLDECVFEVYAAGIPL